MKKIYLSFLACASLALSNAQSLQKVHEFDSDIRGRGEDVTKTTTPVKFTQADISETENTAVHQQKSTRAADFEVVWEETFNGTGALTTDKGVWVAGGPSSAYWAMSSSPNWPINAGFPSYVSGRHLQFYPYGSITEPDDQFATTAVLGTIQTPVIDVTDGGTHDLTDGVILRFDMATMYCCNNQQTPYRFRVSEDGGSSFSPEMDLDVGLLFRNEQPYENPSNTPRTVTIDISDYVSNDQTQVVVEFIWKGDEVDGNGQYNTHYYWNIDNVQFLKRPQYETSIEEFFIVDILGSDDYFAPPQYTEIPLDQAGMLSVSAKVQNLGANTATTPQLMVSVHEWPSQTIVGAGVSGGTLSSGGPFDPGSVDTMSYTTTIDLSDLPLGDYYVRAELVYDDVLDDFVDNNNVATKRFTITEHLMSARDLDYAGPTWTFVGNPNFDADPVEPMSAEIGGRFVLNNAATITGVDFYYGGSFGTWPAPASPTVNLGIYEFVSGSGWTQRRSALVEVPSGSVNSWVTFNFYENQIGSYDPFVMQPDVSYLVTVGVEPPHYFFYRSVGYDLEFTSIKVETDGLTGTKSYSPFDASGKVWLKANFDETLSVGPIEEKAVTKLTAYPNPANNSTTIRISSDVISQSKLTITDITGKIVYTAHNTAGMNEFTVNTSDYSEGLYLYTVEMDGFKQTKRLVINK